VARHLCAEPHGSCSNTSKLRLTLVQRCPMFSITPNCGPQSHLPLRAPQDPPFLVAGSYQAAAYLLDMEALRQQGCAASVMQRLGVVFSDPAVTKVLHDAPAVGAPPCQTWLAAPEELWQIANLHKVPCISASASSITG
jgi:hypothetical protein